jgi:small conductance mechanosensitive channel
VFAASDAAWVRRLRDLHLLTPMRIVLILVVATVLSVLIRRLVTRIVRGLQAVQEHTNARSDPSRVEQRRRTLTTVLRSTLIAIVWLVAFVTVVGELGLNIGAFVATATIIGGALAFGAQTLVRDLIAGFFMIAEDQFGVGDIVDVGPATGVVERVSLRTTRLRDVEGRVWYVPNGQVSRVANLSHHHAVAVIDVPVGIGENLDVVGERLLTLARDLQSDPQIGPSVLDEPTLLGVQEIQEDRVLLRLTIKTLPAQQFVVRRAFLGQVAGAVRRGELPRLPITGLQKEVVVKEGPGPEIAAMGGLD